MNFNHVYLTTKGYETFGSGIIGQKTVTWNECKTYSTDISSWPTSDINNATAASFSSLDQTSIGQVASTSYVSTNDGNSVRIAITLRNTNNSGVPTYNGLARTLCVFGSVNGSNQLLIIATSDEPDTIPQSSEFKAFVDCYIALSQDTISTINAPNSWYATANDLNTLKNRVVTTHVEGNTTQGESQTIYGEKTFISQMTTHAIKPISNNVYNLGDSNYRWSTLYSQNGNFSNNVVVSNDLTVSGDISVTGTTNIIGNILPNDTAVDLGDTNHRFAKMYITGGNNSEQQTCVVIDNSADKTTIRPLTDNTCYLGNMNCRWGVAYINKLNVNGPYGELNITDTKVNVRDETSSSSASTKTLAKYVTDKIQTTSSSVSSSADKWTTARYFTIKDQASPPNPGTSKLVDGSENIDLILPNTIKADLIGTANKATKADKLVTSRTIDGVQFDGSASITHYGTCSTPASTTEKVVTLNSNTKITTLPTGTRIAVKFTNGNTVNNPTLKFGNFTAKQIYTKDGTAAKSTEEESWAAGEVVEFIYDTYWYIVNHVSKVELAANANKVYVTEVSSNIDFPVVFRTANAQSSNSSLFADNKITYNPSTKALHVDSLYTDTLHGNIITLGSSGGLPINGIGYIFVVTLSTTNASSSSHDISLSTNGTTYYYKTSASFSLGLCSTFTRLGNSFTITTHTASSLSDAAGSTSPITASRKYLFTADTVDYNRAVFLICTPRIESYFDSTKGCYNRLRSSVAHEYDDDTKFRIICCNGIVSEHSTIKGGLILVQRIS